VPLDSLLRSKRPVKIRDNHGEAKHFRPGDRRPGGRGPPVRALQPAVRRRTDEAGRLVGVITIDDIVDVIEEEADEDIKRLAGVGDEEITEGVFSIVRLRSSWLLVNLVTAFLSASVIAVFEDTIEAIAILAMLFPIVAGLGGNAGTQTLTVTVRALATQQLNPKPPVAPHRPRIPGRHLQRPGARHRDRRHRALLFSRPELGLVIAGGMLANQTVAALVGIGFR
jgi:magnesium transporter